MAIYLKIEGIDGNVESKGHEKWIECQSMQWGVGRGISTRVGSGLDREASAPSISEVSVTKLMDQASPKIFTESCVGKSKKVELHLTKTGQDQIETFMEYILSDSLISGYSVSSGGDRPTESVSINFTKLEMKFVPWKDDHTKGSPIPASYDMATATKG